MPMVIAAARRKSSARKKVSRHGGFKPIDGRTKAGRALSSLDKAAEANKKRLRAVKSKAKARAKSANNQVVKALKPVDGSKKPVGIKLKTSSKTRKSGGSGRRGRKAGFKHSAATRKKISQAMKKVWASGRRRKLKIKKVKRSRRR